MWNGGLRSFRNEALIDIGPSRTTWLERVTTGAVPGRATELVSCCQRNYFAGNAHHRSRKEPLDVYAMRSSSAIEKRWVRSLQRNWAEPLRAGVKRLPTLH